MITFEGYERRIAQINKCLNDNGIKSIEEAEQICKDKGLNVYQAVKDIQTICFENACWAYTVGAALAIKNNAKDAAEAANGSVLDYNPSVSQALSQMIEKLA